MSQTSDQVYYGSGFDKTVANTHSWRTPENSVAYVLKYIKPTHKILDVGCGPGSITLGLAKYVPQGEVVGVEPTQEVVNAAMESAKKDSNTPTNVRFEVASAYSLPYPDNSFDIVHSHQVLLHMLEPVKALSEMRRVVKPGGYVCCSDADLESLIVFPPKYHEPITNYFLDRVRAPNTNMRYGRQSRQLCIDAGFECQKITTTSKSNCVTGDKKKYYSQMYIKRIVEGSEALAQDTKDSSEEAKKKTREALANVWREWSEEDGGFLTMINVENVSEK